MAGRAVEVEPTPVLCSELMSRSGAQGAAALVAYVPLSDGPAYTQSSKPDSTASREVVIEWAKDLRRLAHELLDFAYEATRVVGEPHDIHEEDMECDDD